MLFLGIDQHARQLTVSLRDKSGDVLLARQGTSHSDPHLLFPAMKSAYDLDTAVRSTGIKIYFRN
ncbi:hypothetical protein SH661x_002799 [Planctomicrobium sp. SH661]|uniref:hypothetical protein n=1 Tax=Planctomicrobium sp. SH661 TaxID=3448124 RepID=UPI003F5C9D74